MVNDDGIDLLAGAFTADWLMGQKFPPLQWVVPGVLPEGMTLLTAAPKVGKSWLVLGLAVACANGGRALGTLEVDGRPVLYLALEDGKRRLQSRLDALNVSESPQALTFVTELSGNAAATIAHFFEIHRGEGALAILDTLGRARPATSSTGNQYQLDYAFAAGLKATVDAFPGTSLIVVHHTRKGGAADFLDEVSGTQGLAGAADTVAVLKREREAEEAVLNVTSRDAAEGSYALTLAHPGTWQLAGGSLDAARERAALTTAKTGLADRSGDILEALAAHPQGATPKQLSESLGIDNDSVGRYLRRLVDSGRAERTGRGRYTPVRSVRTSESPGADAPLFGQTDTSDTPTGGDE